MAETSGEKTLEEEARAGPEPVDAVENMSDAAATTTAVQQQQKQQQQQPEPGTGTEMETETETQLPAPAPAYSVLSPPMKRFLVVMTVFSAFFSPFSSFIYLPAITPIAAEYGRPVADINLSVTAYQVMQAVSPLFFGDLSDQVGRRPAYVGLFAIYLGANVGLALQRDYAALMALRALQSTGCSATVAMGSAVMADFTTAADRGGFMAAVQASIMFAPALAPVLGGILTQFLGWRSTFWFLVVAAGVFLAVYVPFVPETARNIVGNGSIPPPRLNACLVSAYRQRNKGRDEDEADEAQAGAGGIDPPTQRPRRPRRKIPVPNVLAAVLIVFEKDVGLLMLFMSILTMANYAMLVPLQDVIRQRYGFNNLQVGLCYIPFSVGSVAGSIAGGRLLNRSYAKVAREVGLTPDRKRGDDLRRFPIERARLDPMWPWIGLVVATITVWGWVVDSGTSLAAPLVVMFLAGAGLSAPNAMLTTLLVDLYPTNPGRVSSAFNLTRATMSAVGTGVVQHIIAAWGYGLTYLFMGLVMLAASSSVLVVRRWGPRWREERYQRLERAGRVGRE